MRFTAPLLVALFIGIPRLTAAEAASTAAATPASQVSVEQRVLARLGKEHLARATHRTGRDGLRIVAWGRRIIEWPLTGENPPLKEAVPFKEPFEYSNGGCATDLDGDGIDEIVVARGRGQWGNDPDLFYFEETQDGWKEHRIAELGKGSIAPHDILPIAFKGTGGEQREGVVMDIGRRQLIWFEKPQTPGGAWQKRRIAFVNDPIPQQSGIVIGDIAGHGRPDIAWGMFWAECPADPIGEPWQLHRYGDWNDGGWGGMSKVALADMDGDDRDRKSVV